MIHVWIALGNALLTFGVIEVVLLLKRRNERKKFVLRGLAIQPDWTGKIPAMDETRVMIWEQEIEDAPFMYLYARRKEQEAELARMEHRISEEIVQALLTEVEGVAGKDRVRAVKQQAIAKQAEEEKRRKDLFDSRDGMPGSAEVSRG
jgi:hypothetical protein